MKLLKLLLIALTFFVISCSYPVQYSAKSGVYERVIPVKRYVYYDQPVYRTPSRYYTGYDCRPTYDYRSCNSYANTANRISRNYDANKKNCY